MKKQIFSILILLTLVFAQGAKSQCPDILDGGGLPSASPIWISCVGADFNLFIQPVDTLFNYSIDWGDGSPVTTGDTLLPSAFETYLYTAGTFNYPVTITADCGVITGMVIMEISPSASIQIPLGSLAFGCAPASYSFVNSSTNVSPNTIFTWNWGDGSPLEIYGDTNLGDTLSHIYLPNTVGCEVTVTLSADNNCPPSSTNIFFPLQVWAVDNARITSDDTLLCYPDTVVHFDNTTVLNCFVNGNTFQRYEYWNFGDYWGLGYDSIIPWQPWNPPVRPGYDIAFPGLGVYTIMLIDSNFCGRDTTYSTIMIVDPPVAGLSPNPDTICSGESITFANLSAGANSYSWNFGDGSGWNTTGVGSQTHNYLTSGALTVFLAAIITGGSASCVDTASVVVEVLPSPQAIISPSATSGCDSLNVTFTDSSIAAVSWYWDFGNGDTSTSNVPPVISYGSPDTSIVQLLVTGLNGCQDSIVDTITIYETPIVSFTATNVCVNQVTDFIDSSFTGGQPITSWNWDFGDGNTDTVQNPFNTYTSEGPQNVILTISTGFCTATDSAIIFVDTLPIPAFSVDTAAGCSPLTIAFSNTSSGAVSYEWDFGDSTTYIGFDTSHIFTYSGIDDTVYAVRLIATSDSGCMDTTMFSIQVYPPVFASFTQSDTAGCGPLSVDFTNTSLFGSMYFWDFGDGSPIDLAADPTHSFTNAGTEDTTYIIRLIIQSDDGCRDTAYSQMEIYPAPTAAFAATPISQMFPNTTVDFLNLSSVGNFDYAWDFGDGTTDTVMNPGPHTYTTWNSYTIGLIVSGNACSDTTEMVVTILQPPPTAGFTFSDSAGCRPAIFTFKDTSLYADSL
ncbi:MAG: PKD domain-containing protein, partial [Flavobacteriales bacterium]|nr:PKD domain-containing protein [Flavobacteriales bacterium]